MNLVLGPFHIEHIESQGGFLTCPGFQTAKRQ
jgi:hypothetical protein